jgi:glucan phosphorylase
VARNIAGMGAFSADRTVAEYVARVWSPATLPPPAGARRG